MNKRIVFIISIMFILIFLSCAGKPNIIKDSIASGNTKILSDSYKNIFIGVVINNTPIQELNRDLEDQLITYYSLSQDFQYTGSYKNADIMLSLEINNYIEEENPLTESSNMILTRFILNLTASIKNIQSNNYYVKNKKFYVSIKHLLDMYNIENSITEARTKLYNKTISNIDLLLTTGDIPVKFIIGYEDYSEKDDPLLSTKSTSPSITNNDNYFNDGSEELTDEQKREQEISDIDTKGQRQ